MAWLIYSRKMKSSKEPSFQVRNRSKLNVCLTTIQSWIEVGLGLIIRSLDLFEHLVVLLVLNHAVIYVKSIGRVVPQTLVTP